MPSIFISVILFTFLLFKSFIRKLYTFGPSFLLDKTGSNAHFGTQKALLCKSTDVFMLMLGSLSIRYTQFQDFIFYVVLLSLCTAVCFNDLRTHCLNSFDSSKAGNTVNMISRCSLLLAVTSVVSIEPAVAENKDHTLSFIYSSIYLLSLTVSLQGHMELIGFCPLNIFR